MINILGWWFSTKFNYISITGCMCGMWRGGGGRNSRWLALAKFLFDCFSTQKSWGGRRLSNYSIGRRFRVLRAAIKEHARTAGTTWALIFLVDRSAPQIYKACRAFRIWLKGANSVGRHKRQRLFHVTAQRFMGNIPFDFRRGTLPFSLFVSPRQLVKNLNKADNAWKAQPTVKGEGNA